MSKEHAAIDERLAAFMLAQPVFFGVLIITLVYLPILALTGTEGKMFRPMAATVIFALLGSLVVATVILPVLATLLFRKRPTAAR